MYFLQFICCISKILGMIILANTNSIDGHQLEIKASKTVKRAGKGNNTFKLNIEYLILCLPAILFFFVFNYLPMFGVIIAFKDFNYAKGLFGSEWVGFKYFEFFFTSQDAWILTRNTVGYALVFLISGTVMAFVVSLLLYEVKNRTAVKAYQTIMILPFLKMTPMRMNLWIGFLCGMVIQRCFFP